MKKFIAILFVPLFVLSLASCQINHKSGNADGKENAEKTTEYYEYYQNNYNSDSGETDEFVWDIKHLVNYDHKIISPHSGHEYPEIYFNTFEETKGADDGKITNDKFLEAYYNDENEYYKIIKDSYEKYVFMDDSMNYVRVNNEIIDLLEELNKAEMEKETYEKDETICYFSFNYKFKYFFEYSSIFMFSNKFDNFVIRNI